jgi:ketosteroid isomerase-like protein
MTEAQTPDGPVLTHLRRYWAAEEARDVDAILACYAPDGEFVDRLGTITAGHEALRTFYARSVAAFPRAAVEPTRIIERDGVAAVQYAARLGAADGSERTARVAVFVTLERGLISRIESYFDAEQLRG